MASLTPVVGLIQMECEAPSLLRTHPAMRRRRSRSRRFIRSAGAFARHQVAGHGRYQPHDLRGEAQWRPADPFLLPPWFLPGRSRQESPDRSPRSHPPELARSRQSVPLSSNPPQFHVPISLGATKSGSSHGGDQAPSPDASPPSNRQPHPLHPPRRDGSLQPPANRHRPLPLVAHIPRKPQTPKRLGDTTGTATLPPVLPHEQQHP